MTKSAKSQLTQLNVRVTESVIEKIEQLLLGVKPLGHPRAVKEDIVGALIDAANAKQTAKALDSYNPKLGKVLAELEADENLEGS